MYNMIVEIWLESKVMFMELNVKSCIDDLFYNIFYELLIINIFLNYFKLLFYYFWCVTYAWLVSVCRALLAKLWCVCVTYAWLVSVCRALLAKLLSCGVCVSLMLGLLACVELYLLSCGVSVSLVLGLVACVELYLLSYGKLTTPPPPIFYFPL